MLITHVLSESVDTGNIYWLKGVLERLWREFDFELIVPERSRALSILSGTRVKLTALPLGKDDDNMIRNIYIIGRHLRQTAPSVVHSHGSVCGSLATFLVSRGDVVAIKDYYASYLLRRVLSALSPRARLSLTLSYSPSDRDILVRAGVRDGSIVNVPYGVDVDIPTPEDGYFQSSVPIISASCSNGEECALFLSAVSQLVRKRRLLAYVEAPENMALYIRHLSSALGIGRCVVSFGIGAMPLECVRASFCFVLPSLRPSSIPIEAARFMSFGVPAVVPNTPRCLDLVRDGTSGAVYHFGDSFSLSAAVDRLLSRNGERDELSRCARGKVVGSYSLDGAVLALSSLYRSLA